jgi:tetratricopeptide (TPR) repeat protein
MRPDDAWNYGVIGDASIELGEYEDAFEAFDTMMTMRPNGAAYARIAYARELKGHVRGALEAMQMAVQSTTAHDPEAQAWYVAHVGELYLRMGNLDDAEREFARADYIFPNYPYARIGQGKVLALRGDRAAALAVFSEQFARMPSLDLAARIGDLHAEGGNRAEAERFYQLGEDLAGPGLAQTEASLALFLAERDRKVPEAVKNCRDRGQDATRYLHGGCARLGLLQGRAPGRAAAASKRALRTGTRDEKMLARAAVIQGAQPRASRSG